jgi:hypothetical protein
MNSERNKIILVVALLIAASGVYWFTRRPATAVPDAIQMVCVATGERFAIARDKLPTSPPFKNPKTGELTLLPIFEDGGKYWISARTTEFIRGTGQLAKVNKYVDPETREVLTTPRP